jgi:predicted unusual protein kinase regulating ubiquinone biosynthesis (AarF/ABC1/UbiB family)
VRLAPCSCQPHLSLTFTKLLTPHISDRTVTKRATNTVLKLGCLHIVFGQWMSTRIALSILALFKVMIYRHPLIEHKAFALPPALF